MAESQKVTDLPDEFAVSLSYNEEELEQHFETILDEAAQAFNTAAKIEEFKQKHQHVLDKYGSTCGSLIHKIAEGRTLKSYEKLLKLLLTEYPDLLEIQNDECETALYIAIKKGKHDLVEFLCKNSPRAVDALGVRRKTDTCLHKAIEKKLSCLEYLIGKCSKDMFKEADGDGNTPLHVAVDYAQCVKETHAKIVQLLLDRCDFAMVVSNKAGMTPYQHHHETAKRNRSLKGVRTTDKDRQSNQPVIAKEIQWILRLHCLRSQNHAEAVKILYGRFPSMLSKAKV